MRERERGGEREKGRLCREKGARATREEKCTRAAWLGSGSAGGGGPPARPTHFSQMSRFAKGKHVLTTALQEEVSPPGPGQAIVRALGSRGGNLVEVRGAA